MKCCFSREEHPSRVLLLKLNEGERKAGDEMK